MPAGRGAIPQRRVALFPSREVLIEDRLTGLKPGRRVRWGLITEGTPGSLGTPIVELCQRGARLTLRIVSPDLCGWKVIDTATASRMSP
jgi:hypothetical protein